MCFHCQSNPSFLLELSGPAAGSNPQTGSAAGASHFRNRVSVFFSFNIVTKGVFYFPQKQV